MSKQIALVGKPNCGKSSLFNLITGLNQKIANYSGATVDRKTGHFLEFKIIDLPGIKTLKSVTEEEKISKQAILDYSLLASPILFIANGMLLEDNLLLFSEIADFQIPCILVINFKDDLLEHQIEIDLEQLQNTIGCPALLMNSRTGEGLDEVKRAIIKDEFQIPNAVCRSLYDKFEDDKIANEYKNLVANSDQFDTQLFQDDFHKRQKIIGSIIQSTTHYKDSNSFLENSKKWDKILLNPFWGILLFLFTMLVIFQSMFFLAGFPMDLIDQSFSILSVWSKKVIGIEWLGSLVGDGIIPGLGGVLIFIPQIAILFFLLGVLEHSGYLARISYISNRFLSKFGLSGQSVIPLMSSWACAIPAIMSAKAIQNPKERIAVILASPLMTCSARLPVYTILIAIMVPNKDLGFFNYQGLIMLGLYLLGVIATLVVAYIVSTKTKVKGSKLWALELPVYRVPNWRNVFLNAYQKTKSFVIDAGKVIFIVSMVLWLLASFSPKSEEFIDAKYNGISKKENSDPTSSTDISRDAVALEYSYAGYLGKIIEPVIKPLGYDWKIGIALISSFAAREVFVGSLATIYSVGSEEEGLIQDRLTREVNIETGQPRYNTATIVSLLLFYVFALQCMSTLAIVKKETGNWTYPILQFVGMGLLAYVAAFIGYVLCN